MSIEDRVRRVLVEEFDLEPDQIRPEAHFVEDLELDSLETIEIVMALEEEFGIEISDKDASRLKTIGDVLNYVKGRVQEVPERGESPQE